MGKTNERLRCITWEDYGIDKERYRELKHFCLQYPGKKKKSAELGEYNLPALATDGAGGSGKISRPTEAAAIKHYTRTQRYIQDCRMIDEAAMWAASAGGYRRCWRALLRSVTEGKSYDQVLGLYAFMPYTKTDFYAVRRAFFHRLDVIQSGLESPENTEESEDKKVGTN